MTDYRERSTFHTGKRDKTGKSYHSNHNGLEKNRERLEHVNPEKFHENVYHYYCVKSGKMITEKGGNGGVEFKKFEREYFKTMFQEGLNNQNERYKKDRHSENCKTLYQFMESKPAMEIETELGNVNSDIPLKERGEILQAATLETFDMLQEKFGNNIQVLSHAFHADEGMIDDSKISYANHMHTRMVFFVDGKDQSRDKHGDPLYNENGDKIMCKIINQSEALRQMGFGVPKYKKNMTLEQMTEAVRNPENWGPMAMETELYRQVQEKPEMLKHTKICTPLVAFTDFARSYFNDQLERQAQLRGIDLTIEREAINKSYRKMIKEGKVDLSRDVISDPDRSDYLRPDEYKAKREEERATAAREAADREAERQQELIEQNQELVAENQELQANNDCLVGQNQEFEKSLGSKEKAIKIADAKIKQRKDEITSLDRQAESSTERRNRALQEEVQVNDRIRAATNQLAAKEAELGVMIAATMNEEIKQEQIYKKSMNALPERNALGMIKVDKDNFGHESLSVNKGVYNSLKDYRDQMNSGFEEMRKADAVGKEVVKHLEDLVSNQEQHITREAQRIAAVSLQEDKSRFLKNRDKEKQLNNREAELQAKEAELLQREAELADIIKQGISEALRSVDISDLTKSDRFMEYLNQNYESTITRALADFNAIEEIRSKKAQEQVKKQTQGDSTDDHEWD